MKLASPAKVLLAMGVVSNDGSLLNAGQALDFSFPIIENALETKLQVETVTDYFDIEDRTTQSFRLTNTFIDPDSVVVRASSDGSQLETPTAGEVLASNLYYVDKHMGVVAFRGRMRYGRCVLSVTYEHGLPTDDSDETLLVAPYWLQEIATGLATQVLNTIPASPGSRKDRFQQDVGNAIHALASRLLNGFRRPRLNVTWPARTVVHD